MPTLIEKYARQIGSSPQVGVKIKNVWNHPVIFPRRNSLLLENCVFFSCGKGGTKKGRGEVARVILGIFSQGRGCLSLTFRQCRLQVQTIYQIYTFRYCTFWANPYEETIEPRQCRVNWKRFHEHQKGGAVMMRREGILYRGPSHLFQKDKTPTNHWTKDAPNNI